MSDSTLSIESDALPGAAVSTALRKRDLTLVRRVVTVVREHMADPHFDTLALSRELGYSRMHVNRRLQAIMGCSTGAFVRLLCMRCARNLLEQGDLPVAEVARSVGFRSASHFASVFKTYWGVSPKHLRGKESTGTH